MPGSNGNGHNQRLDSWKEIAAYLRRDERTAIRWQDRGLPVHRVPGGKRAAVFAFTAELDSWLTRTEPQGLKPSSAKAHDGTSELVPFPDTSIPDATPHSMPGLGRSPQIVPRAADSLRHRWVWVLAFVGIGVVLATTIVKLAFGHRAHADSLGVPVRVTFTLNSLQAFDAEDHMLWAHALPGTLNPTELFDWRKFEDGVRIANFRGDGQTEVLALTRTRVNPNSKYSEHSEVDMLSGNGTVEWSYMPQGHLVFARHDLKDSFLAEEIFVSPRPGKKQIWVASDHAIWGHSFVVSLDPDTGKDTLRFVNGGTTYVLNELSTSQGNFLLAGGFNNEADSGYLAIIDEARAFAASPQVGDSSHKCLNCPPGDPDYYFVFPRSEVNRLMQFYEDHVFYIRVTSDAIEIRKKETDTDPGAQTLYELTTKGPIRPVSVQFETRYDLLHKQLEREGKITHTIEHCPERLHPKPVRMWTPGSGWMDIQIDPSRSD